VRVTVEVDAAAVEEAVRRLGWRVYATNAPAEQLTLTQAVLAYRNEYIIERSFGRLKGKPLSLTPMYLQRDDHATGLTRLVTIGLWVLRLLELLFAAIWQAKGANWRGCMLETQSGPRLGPPPSPDFLTTFEIFLRKRQLTATIRFHFASLVLPKSSLRLDFAYWHTLAEIALF
jgi:hypothetical protein